MKKWRELVRNLQRMPGTLLRWRIAALFVFLVAASGCGIKRSVHVAVPSGLLNAKTASLEELVTRINSICVKLKSLSSSTMKVTLTSGRIESGLIQKYPRAPGYILLSRPNDLRMNIQNPLTKTAILELRSSGDDFSLWLPSRNQFLEGKNSAGEIVISEGDAKLEFAARPTHILHAILPQPIVAESTAAWWALEEERDENSSSYALSIYHEGSGRKLILDRKLWLERTAFLITREQTYGEDGKIAGSIRYSDYVALEGVPLPLSIEINRPIDGYTLRLEFKDWKLNSDLPADAFEQKAPAGAQVIRLTEKQKDEKQKQ